MNELQNIVWIERYRPQSFSDLICEHKDTILKYLSKPKEIPSFIFYSQSPGTGKTSCARLIAKTLGCDMLKLNSSEERGIDIIRDKIKSFAQSMSSQEGIKRLVFLDEADGLTKQALDSLRNLMEEFSSNVFFIFSCNDLNKIIEPIRSRCVTLSFEKPSRKEIFNKMIDICDTEKVTYSVEDIGKLVGLLYPDLRAMILTLQSSKIDNKSLLVEYDEYNAVLQTLLHQDANKLYSKAFSQSFNVLGFNRWLFNYLFEHYEELGFEKVSAISLYIAEIEKAWELGANIPIVFITNMMQVSKILNE